MSQATINDFFKFSIGENHAIVNITSVFNITSDDNIKVNKIIDSNDNNDFVYGVIDVLGTPVPVIRLQDYIRVNSLNEQVNLENKEDNKNMILILKIVDEVNNRQKLLGLLIESITDTLKISSEEAIFEQDTTLLFHKAFHDILKIDGEFLYKLDVERLFQEIPRQWDIIK